MNEIIFSRAAVVENLERLRNTPGVPEGRMDCSEVYSLMKQGKLQADVQAAEARRRM